MSTRNSARRFVFPLWRPKVEMRVCLAYVSGVRPRPETLMPKARTAPLSIDRRLFLTGSAALALATWLGIDRVMATEDEVAAAIDEFTGGIEPTGDRVAIEIEERVENGSNVPVTVSVDAPLSGDDRVESVILLGKGNPYPVVATFHFSPLLASAAASSRIRLAQSQTIVAVARFADGTFSATERTIDVAVGGCVM